MQLERSTPAVLPPDNSTLGQYSYGVPIGGFVAKGYEPVREAFLRNFREQGELGAALCVYVEGEPVVDLWAGWRDPDRRQPWERDTMALTFSTTKGVAAMVCALAHSRGWLHYDEPVSRYWPEFAENGKGGVTVRQLLNHEAGLSAIDEPLDLALLTDLDRLAPILARQRPSWTPGTRHGYHPLTLGLYQNELIRRTDPQHRTIGQVLQKEIAAPLGVDIYIGLPAKVDDRRIAILVRNDSGWARARALTTLPMKFVLGLLSSRTLTFRTFHNLKLESITDLNTRPYLEVELPSVNAVLTARGLAKLYGDFAVGSPELGVTPETLARFEAAGTHHPDDRDAVLFVPSSFAYGFWKPCAPLPFSSSPRAYGNPGAGGSAGFADPSRRLGFAYVPNQLCLYLLDDPRATILREAVFACTPG